MARVAPHGVSVCRPCLLQGYGYEHSPLAEFSAKKIRDKLNSIGMICANCQCYFAELHNEFEQKMAFSHQLGLKNVICAPETIPLTKAPE